MLYINALKTLMQLTASDDKNYYDYVFSLIA